MVDRHVQWRDAMNMLQNLSALSIVVAFALPACANREPQPAPSAPPPPPPSAAADGGTGASTNMQGANDTQSVEKLAAARCDHEEACNHVGTGQKYASREVCMDQMRGSVSKDLNSNNCPNGLDQAAIERCMSAIRGEDCGHPLDTLERLDKCRTGALCP